MMRHLNQPKGEIDKMSIEEINVLLRIWDNEQRETEREYKKMERKSKRFR